MTWIASTLWDLITGSPTAQRPAASGDSKAQAVSDKRRTPRDRSVGANHQHKTRLSRNTMQQKYDSLVEEMKRGHNVQVRKWRKSSSGLAWEIRYRDGTTRRFIAAPYPRGPMSCAVFLHEIGHHAIGLGRYKPRCLEEYHAWDWAIRTMRERGLNVTPAVEKRVEQSLQYAVRKARRRGIRSIPVELARFV